MNLIWQSTMEAGGIDSAAVVETARGELMLEDVRPGDRIMTMDHGFQPVVEIHESDRSKAVAAVVVSCSVLGAVSPLRLASDQGILLKGWLLKALISESEVISQVGIFENGDHIRSTHGNWRALLPVFENPELIRCNGMWLCSGSLLPGTPRPDLPEEYRLAIVESGLFVRREGERHARGSSEIAINA